LSDSYTMVILYRMKTAISIPDELHRSADLAAKRMGLSRSELYRRALIAFLAMTDEMLITKALDEVYKDEPARIDPVLARLQDASLPCEEW
jgi:antitoxin MazE6